MAMKKYLYETHLHTSPVSRCATGKVRDHLEHYKRLGYAGVFITNHFIDGNMDFDKSRPYEEQIGFYFSDYEEAVKIGREIGISVFSGIESSYQGTDFLVFGLDKAWFLAHPEIMSFERKGDQLAKMREAGALVIHAHPFYYYPKYHDHIKLYPGSVDGVEVYNAHRTDAANEMARLYAETYGLIPFAGSDNHDSTREKLIGGMSCDVLIKDEADFVARVKRGELDIFKMTVDERLAML